MLPSNHLIGLLSIVLSLLTIHGTTTTTTTTDASSQSQPTAATTTRAPPTSRAPIKVLTSALVNEHDLPSEELARAVLRLFSVGERGGDRVRTADEAARETETQEEEMWECDLIRVVREIGVGLLVASKVCVCLYFAPGPRWFWSLFSFIGR
jgi:DNA-directed RNA polymerase subunit H (RpoH/RPB5)